PEVEDFVLTGELGAADLVLMHANTDDWAEQNLIRVRAQLSSFLKPILIVSETTSARMQSLVDAVVKWPALETTFVKKIRNLHRVVERLESLPDLPESLGDVGLKKILLLRYLYSRDPYTLRPLRNFHASVGYCFPLVQVLFDAQEGQAVAFLENLEEAQLLTTKLVDKVNVCPRCSHSQINFRELCPTCRSLNISEESTIHHFRCAHVGRETEYRRGFKFNCPKCSRELRHIGVDYDKPAEVMWCNDCNHNFSDPLLSCFCLVCGNSCSPEDVFLKQINEYSLSLDGFRAAEEGVMPGFGLISILKRELGFYKYEVFIEYLRLEIFRCRRYEYPSTLARFSFKDLDGGTSRNEMLRSRKLKKEFAALIKGTFRSTDLLTDLQDGQIFIIFTNTDYDSTQIAFKRLDESMKSLLQDRFNLKYELIDLRSENQQLDKLLEAAG
ncbi:hypothetical protein MJD09_19775, partial [bacterium]|nr:hypothetical protein [bacterium]